MGTNYTRQSSYSSGDTITAAHSNNEFDRLESAFSTSGHSHDGTAGEGGAITSLTANCTVPDNVNLIFGTNSDVSVQYDETTTDSLRIAALEGAAVAITFAADEGDDAGDEWKLNIADGGVLTLGNDINSAGTYVTHLTLTPNATVANSTAAFAGNVTVAGDLTISGDDLTMGTNTSGHVLVADGTNFNPVALSGDVTIASNGAVTIANQAVENAMLADDAVGADELAANAVVNASVASSAAIAFSKMADLTASRALVSDGSGDVSVSSVTSTEIGYLDITTLGTSEASKAVTVDSNGDLLIPDSDKFKFGAGSDMQVYHDGTNSYITNSEGALKIATETSGIAVTIGHGTSEVTVADNLTVTGDFTVNGATTTLNTTTLTVGDTLIKLNQGYTGSAYDQGVVFTRGNGSSSNTQNMAFIWDESEDTFATIQASTEDGTTAGNVTVNDYANLHVGALTADDNSTFTGNVTAANVVVANDGDIGSAGATDAMQISSAGIVTFKDDIKIKDGGTIGVASAADAMTISSAGIVTFKDDILLKDAATIGNASVADVMTLASTGVVTFKDDIVIKDAGTIGSASDTDAIAIAANGVVTFSQVPLFPADTIETADIQDNAVTPAKIAGAVNAQTGTTYTLVIGDAFKTVTMSNSSSNTLTIPPNSSVAFAVGDRIDVVMLGSGTTTVTGGSGVTVNGVSTGSGAIAAQYAAVSCLKLATDTWILMGNHGGVS